MSIKNSVRPEDILPDGVDTAVMNGITIRKGTIAAFLANIDILEDPASNDVEKSAALKAMKELAPSVIAIGLHKHVIFNNPEAEQVLVDARMI